MTKKSKANKYLVAIVLIVLLMAMLLFNLLGRIWDVNDAKNLPCSRLTKEVTKELSRSVLEGVDRVVKCPTISYELSVPRESQNADELLKGTFGNVSYIVMETNQDIYTLATNTMPGILYTKVPGFKLNVTEAISDAGYYNNYKAEYQANIIESRVSVRSIKQYALTLRFNLDESRALVLYVSVTDKNYIKDAEALLYAMADSITKIDPEEITILDSNSEHSGTSVSEPEIIKKEDYAELPNEIEDAFLPMYMEHEISTDIEDCYYMFFWGNVKYEPVEVTVTGPNGQEGIYQPEESYAGGRVFRLGDQPAGTYVLTGSTLNTLTGCYCEVYTKEAYERMYVNYGID